MKILGIESASLPASVALFCDDRIIGSEKTDLKKTHSETLLPMVDSLFKKCDMTMKEIDAIAVSVGPGSFTGLRIGVSAAKGLAFPYHIPVIPVPTLDAMAYSFFASPFIIVPLMDARRSEAYTGFYRFSGSDFQPLLSPLSLPITEVIRKAEDFSEEYQTPALYTGDGLPVFSEAISENAKRDYLLAPPHLRTENAESVCVLGQKLFTEGIRKTPEEIMPFYLRASQAEQERMAKGLSILPEEDLK